ncbi:TonB-dependent receptor [Kordia sp. TARA_039_SRF]|nr:TonB-dependent receptor [Kordia sp. TARA_039_SRF]
MGKRRRNKTIRLAFLSLVVSFLIQHFSFAQTKIFGTVFSNKQEALYAVNIILKDSSNTKTIAYTFSNDSGYYEILTEKIGTFNLTFSALGFENKTISIEIDTTQKEANYPVILLEKPFDLDTVIIEGEIPMSIKKDTINFKAKYYVRGNEETVEQLLKNIPGLNIDNQGTIKIGNQEIEKLMIDGDDLFDKGYKILSKNMPAYPIDEVEIIKNYSNNPLLKDIENSDKVALNLKLNEKSKRIWFGNVEANYGNDNFYHHKLNLMNFGKKNKYYFLTNFNNIGYNATGDIEYLVRPFRTNQPASIGDNQKVRNLIDLRETSLQFEDDRVNFNNAELVSLNAIFNPTKKLKIKFINFLNWNETNFFRNSIDAVDVNGSNFVNTEDYKLRNIQRIAFGKIDMQYNISSTKMLEMTTKYNTGRQYNTSNLLFNGDSTLENLKNNNTLFDQKISYTNRFKDKKVLLLTGRLIYEETPQNYNLNRFFYEELFIDNTSTSNVRQQIANQMLFAGADAHLLDRKDNGNLFELQLSNEFRKDKLRTGFTLYDGETILALPEDYQNRTEYQVNNLSLKGKYQWKFENFSVTGNIRLHQLINRLENNNITTTQTPFFINPSVSMQWKINPKNKIVATYSYNVRNATILDVYDNFVLTGFRSFNRGLNQFNQLDSSSLVLNYQLGNWSDRFFVNTLFFYGKNHDFFSTNTTLNPNFVQSEKILIQDREFFNIDTKFDYFFKFISSNFKVNLAYSQSEFKNSVNNNSLRIVTSKNFQYGFELRSGFSGFFNYHLGTKWIKNTIETTFTNSFTNNVSFLDLIFIINDRLNIQLDSERYFFGNLENENTYYFADFTSNYKIIKDKLTVGITGKNLFNTTKFRNLFISDIGTSVTEFRLLERFVLLKLEYRF